MKGVEQIEHTLHNLASPKRGHTFWGLVAVLAVAAALMWIKHGVWLQSPNEFMLVESPDGFKNYMTAAWHVRHDSSYVHYAGMNYPFGEHVLFTDNQPIVSAAMQWWSRHVFDVSDRVIGIMNVLQVLSVLLGAGVIYLLLRKLHLPVWYAGLAALGIALLSPQHNRFDGHFGLSHSWVLPMLLLLLCRYEERQSRRYQSLLIGVLIWVAAQLHFYNLGVSAVFLGFYTLFQILLDRSWRNIWTRASHLAVMVLLPFALLNVWIHWSDYCPDRPANPYGFTTYIGYWEGVFLPYENFPMYKWLDQNIIKIRRIDFEAQAYAGLAAFAFTLWLMFKRRFRMFEPSWDAAAYHRVHKNYLRGVCFAAIAILLFGLGFPFAIPGLEWTADYLGPFRQFRGLGRFTWAFYYAINVLLFYVVWNRSVRTRDKIGGFFAARFPALAARLEKSLPKFSLFALLPLAIVCWEAFYFQKNKPPRPVPNTALRSVVADSPDHWLNKVDFARFQALMPLPYYHVGSENIWLDMFYPLYQKVQNTALQTGVPDMGVNMSRSAVGRMVKSMQFALPACQTPVLLSEMPDNRPIALMIEPRKWEEVKIHYRHLVQKAVPVYESPAMKIMALVPDSVRSWAEEEARNLSAEIEQQASYDAGQGWRSSEAPQGLWFKHLDFDTQPPVKYIFQGRSAGEANLGDTTWIWNKHIPKGQYTFSIWIKVDEDMGMTHEVKIVENSPADGHEVHFKHEGLRFYIQTIVNGWALFEVHFEVYDEDSNLNIFLHKKNVNATFWYDEALIKHKNLTLYRHNPGWLQRNGFWHQTSAPR